MIDRESGSYDATGLALAALSCYAGYEDEIAANKRGFKKSSRLTGVTIHGEPFNANTTACVLFGMSALNENLADWTTASSCTPLDALLSFMNPAADFMVTWAAASWTNTPRSRRPRHAEQINAASFYKNITLNTARYISVTVQVLKDDGSFTEKALTVDPAVDDTLDEIASRALGEAVSGGYDYYVDGNTVLSVSEDLDGKTILAIPAGSTDIAYFSYEGSGIGSPNPTIPFEGSADFTLCTV